MDVIGGGRFRAGEVKKRMSSGRRILEVLPVDIGNATVRNLDTVVSKVE